MIYHTYELHLCKCSGDEVQKGCVCNFVQNFGKKCLPLTVPMKAVQETKKTTAFE